MAPTAMGYATISGVPVQYGLLRGSAWADRVRRVHDMESPEAETYPGIAILRFDGGLFFVNADALGDRLRAER